MKRSEVVAEVQVNRANTVSHTKVGYSRGIYSTPNPKPIKTVTFGSLSRNDARVFLP